MAFNHREPLVVTPGAYQGRIADYGIREKSDGKPYGFVDFEINAAPLGEQHKQLVRLRWFANVASEKAASFSLTILINELGFKGTTLLDLALPTSLELGYESKLIIENTTNQNTGALKSTIVRVGEMKNKSKVSEGTVHRFPWLQSTLAEMPMLGTQAEPSDKDKIPF